MKRFHTMPFGSELLSDNHVRFRLWAPSAQTVSLVLDDTSPVAMDALEGGWYEYISNIAKSGSRYNFQIDNGALVPDPASRFNPDDVNAQSQVIDPKEFEWQDDTWRGRPWEEAVLYELHVGTYTPEGTFEALEKKLDYLANLGITAIELMPIADFPGKRNWGYDGVLLFAPDSTYGSPHDLKSLIQAAHLRGLMVYLDVVYNHFGPEGNFLHMYARDFFTDRHQTPWGTAINFDGEGSRVVRDFFINNALYWLEEYHFDGLRLDAVHSIRDESSPDILDELARAVRTSVGQNRHVHLMLENNNNSSHYLSRCDERKCYDAQWNDDAHHALHVLLTGEVDGYYADYSEDTIGRLGRCLTQGFSYQGEQSAYHQGQRRGEPSSHLPINAFVLFLQNHDQIGNRAFGERITSLADSRALTAATGLILLAPSPPLIFMGEEWGSLEPFSFFCDWSGDLAAKVTEGRRNEFARFGHFSIPEVRETIPDPCDVQTFEHSRLKWQSLAEPPYKERLALYRDLLDLRRKVIIPRLRGTRGEGYSVLGPFALQVRWRLGDNSRLEVHVNLGELPVSISNPPTVKLMYTNRTDLQHELSSDLLSPYSVTWYLEGDYE